VLLLARSRGREMMLADAVTQFLSVCLRLSVTSLCSMKSDERYLVFGTEASFDQSYTVF